MIGAAEGGLLHVTGEGDGPPTKPGVGIIDMCTGLYLHGAIASALLAREKTGLGQKIDTSLFETTISTLANVGMAWLNLGKEAQRWGTGHPTIVPYEAFTTKDAHIVVGAVNDRQFNVLCERLGNTKLAQDPRFRDNNSRIENRKELKCILDKELASESTSFWEERFEGSGLPYGPINNMEKVFSHPQAIARNMIETVEQGAALSGKIQVLGKFFTILFTLFEAFTETVVQTGMPVKFSESKGSIRRGPPGLGEHTDDILQELGVPSTAISDLRKNGVI